MHSFFNKKTVPGLWLPHPQCWYKLSPLIDRRYSSLKVIVVPPSLFFAARFYIGTVDIKIKGVFSLHHCHPPGYATDNQFSFGLLHLLTTLLCWTGNSSLRALMWLTGRSTHWIETTSLPGADSLCGNFLTSHFVGLTSILKLLCASKIFQH